MNSAQVRESSTSASTRAELPPDWLPHFETPGLWLAVVGLALIAGWGALLRLERARGWRRWRVWVWGIALGCLWILFARPMTRAAAAPVRAVLLTRGASAEIAQRLADSPDESLLFTKGGEVSSGLGEYYGQYQPIPDALWIARAHPEVTELEVAGFGLESWDIERLPFQILPAELPGSGREMISVTWQRDVVLGRSLEVRVGIDGLVEGERLRLIGPAGVETTVELDPRSIGEVVLRARPKKPGRQLYRLEIADQKGVVLSSEPVGVSVVVPPKRRVLWLQFSPSFEARHVKNWLAESGSEILFRSRISRDRFRTEYLNMEGRRFRGFRQGVRREVLSEFDLVVLDRRSLLDLGRSGRGELIAAIAEDGIGVLLLPESGTRGLGEPFAALSVDKVPGTEALTVRPRWPGSDLEAELAIDPREIRVGSSGRPLVEDAAGRVLAAVAPHGKGLVGVSVLTDTFRWRLEGERGAYAALWSRLVEQLSRSHSAASWGLPDGPVLVDRPLEIELFLSMPPGALPEVSLEDPDGTVPVALRQDPLEPSKWFVKLWPRQPGWHRLTVSPDSEASFHVAGAAEWSWWRNSERYRATLDAGLRPAPRRAPPGRRWRSLSAVPSFLLLVGCLGTLWLDERRRR